MGADVMRQSAHKHAFLFLQGATKHKQARYQRSSEQGWPTAQLKPSLNLSLRCHVVQVTRVICMLLQAFGPNAEPVLCMG
jgi:hypothetical protein